MDMTDVFGMLFPRGVNIRWPRDDFKAPQPKRNLWLIFFTPKNSIINIFRIQRRIWPKTFRLKTRWKKLAREKKKVKNPICFRSVNKSLKKNMKYLQRHFFREQTISGGEKIGERKKLFQHWTFFTENNIINEITRLVGKSGGAPILQMGRFERELLVIDLLRQNSVSMVEKRSKVWEKRSLTPFSAFQTKNSKNKSEKRQFRLNPPPFPSTFLHYVFPDITKSIEH